MKDIALAVFIAVLATVFVRPLFSSSDDGDDSYVRKVYAKGVRNGCQQVLLDARMSKEEPTTIGIYCDKLYWETLKAWDKARSRDKQ